MSTIFGRCSADPEMRHQHVGQQIGLPDEFGADSILIGRPLGETRDQQHAEPYNKVEFALDPTGAKLVLGC